MTRVLVVEDQQTLAGALAVAIDSQPDLTCVGIAKTADDAVRLVDEHAPDVVLMDIHLPGADGIEGTRRIKASHPDIRVLVLTGDAAPDRFAQAAAAGAAGFLAKDSDFPHVLAAIRAPVEGKIIVEGITIDALVDNLRNGETPRTSPVTDRAGLTPREREVLELMGEALDPRAIAKRLVVSEHTVRGHVKNILRKLGAHSQLEAVVVATRSGMLPERRSPAV